MTGTSTVRDVGMFALPAAIASPCVKLCRIDADHRCAGCYRTIDEIARWSAESAEWRAAIMAELPARRP
ncbi:DUF1289 domain-containing protein [Sphingomonas sp.]|uniref:DUF1289 domain-containing protein n=2 Tax=Sphingomonas sp. TaxID=28214 RepID=UPI0035A84F9D